MKAALNISNGSDTQSTEKLETATAYPITETKPLRTFMFYFILGITTICQQQQKCTDANVRDFSHSLVSH